MDKVVVIFMYFIYEHYPCYHFLFMGIQRRRDETPDLPQNHRHGQNDRRNQAGFELEEFGGNSVKISAVPSEITGIAIKDLFLELLYSLQKEIGVIENDKAEYFIFTMACKAAVKANMNLNIVEIEALISEMMKLENPFTCPHGRPTAIKMTKYELEKKFKRT